MEFLSQSRIFAYVFCFGHIFLIRDDTFLIFALEIALELENNLVKKINKKPHPPESYSPPKMGTPKTS